MSSDYDALERRGFQCLRLTNQIVTMEAQGQLLAVADRSLASRLLGQFEAFVPNIVVRRLGEISHAFAVFYCFEAMARQFVLERLQETKGENWWDSVPNKIKDRVKGEKEAAIKNKWHDVAALSEMDYTLFSDLYSIIDTHWNDFKDFFPDLNWVKSRLNDLERSRNAVMHARSLPPSEISRMEQYFDDWIDQVG